MSRQIKDALFIEAVERLGMDIDLFSSDTIYFGNVRNDIEKVTIEQSSSFLSPVSFINDMNLKYQALYSIVKNKMCYFIRPDGKKMDVAANRIALVRTLVIAQISECEEFSMVMAACAICVVNSIMNNKDTCELIPDTEKLTPLQKHVVEEVQEWVSLIY